MKAVIVTATTAALGVIGAAATYGEWPQDATAAVVPETVIVQTLAEISPETDQPPVAVVLPADEPVLLAELSTNSDAPADTMPVLSSDLHLAAMDASNDSGREPILCAFWAIQKFGEQVGILDQQEHDIAASAFPVPAPIWVMNHLLSIGEQNI